MVRYVLDRELGQGALGRVLEVIDLDTGRALAGKLLHDSYRDEPRARARFAREVEFLRELASPNVVAVYELVTIDDREVLLMERVDGPSLARVLAAQGPLPGDRLLAVARGIAAGLAAAHQRGLIHRDLKPANVLLAEGDVPKLVDFGLARATSTVGVDRAEFALVGTPAYLAPESVDPLAVDTRSDLYALGCMLYEMTMGQPPYDGATAFAILAAHRRAPIPELAQTAERPEALCRLITSLLAKSPADRPQSAGAVIEALDAIARGESRALLPCGAAGAEGTTARCARCGGELFAAVPICFACGGRLPSLSPGDHSVFVTGPGTVADKLAPELRQRLVAWLRSTPSLGLDPAPIAAKTPRLPFVLAARLEASSAATLAEALAALGVDAEVRRGGALALPALRSKTSKLSGRAAAILLGSTAGLFHMLPRHPALFVPLVLVFAAGVLGVGVREATRRATRALPPRRQLAPGLEAMLGAAADAVPTLSAARHRDALRGVTRRVLALASGSDDAADGGDGRGDELARVLGAAAQATLRLDTLDRELVQSDLRDTDPATRAVLEERDRLSARLLELTARLDGLRIRAAGERAQLAGRELARALDELEAEVAAREELQAP